MAQDACAASDDDEQLLLALLADSEALDLDLDLLPLSDDALASPRLPRTAATANSPVKSSGDDDPGALITKAVAAAIARRRRSGASVRKRQPPKLTAAAATGTIDDAGNAKKLLKYNTNKARDERREELLYLRRKVAELETRLTEMRVRVEEQPQPQQQLSRGPAADARQTTAAVRKAGVWEEIAGRQHELRMAAERENIRLKLVLESQLKLAKSLEKLLKKTASAKVR